MNRAIHPHLAHAAETCSHEGGASPWPQPSSNTWCFGGMRYVLLTTGRPVASLSI